MVRPPVGLARRARPTWTLWAVPVCAAVMALGAVMYASLVPRLAAPTSIVVGSGPGAAGPGPFSDSALGPAALAGATVVDPRHDVTLTGTDATEDAPAAGSAGAPAPGVERAGQDAAAGPAPDAPVPGPAAPEATPPGATPGEGAPASGAPEGQGGGGSG